MDIAAKIDYMETELYNVVMSEKQLWSLIADSLAVIYALEISDINFRLAITMNHSKSDGLLFSDVWLCCLCICCVIQEFT